MVEFAEAVARIASEVGVLLMGNLDWMGWNLFLAFLPLYLAAQLFRRPRSSVGRPLWWLGVAAFFALLPNAPYVLTDLIHLPRDVAAAGSPWQAAFGVVPMYVAFCGLGFLSYVVSLMWLVRMVRLRGWSARSITLLETGVHLCAALGIYLGRFVRFNSWDIVSRPAEVAATVSDTVTQIGAVAFIAVFFIATCLLYWPSKHLVIAAVAHVRSGQAQRSNAAIERYL